MAVKKVSHLRNDWFFTSSTSRKHLIHLLCRVFETQKVFDVINLFTGETIFKTEKQGYVNIQALVAIIMAAYLLVANILLINLLIAIFK